MTLESLPSSSSSSSSSSPLVNGTKAKPTPHNDDDDDEEQTHIKNHPVYYFPDGTLIIDVETQRFRVHRGLVVRHSRYLSSVAGVAEGGSGPAQWHRVRIEPSLEVRVEDIEALLGHLYHDVHLEDNQTPLTHTISLLRVSSPTRLDLPHLHQLAKTVFARQFKVDPEEEVRHLDARVLYAALPVAKEFGVREAMKAIYYSLVATTEFDMSEETGGSADTPSPSPSLAPTPTLIPPPTAPALSAQDAQTCQALMTSLIDHFTPILFTPPAASHMECTDVFAGAWMGLVIQPAISGEVGGGADADADGRENANGNESGKETGKTKDSGMGVYKPLETLKRIGELDWEGVGVCTACVREKREEWGRERRGVWSGVGGWIGLEEEGERV